MRRHEDADETYLWDIVQRIVGKFPEGDAREFLASLLPRGTLTNNTVAAQRRRQTIRQLEASLRPAAAAQPRWETWLSELEKKETVGSKTLAHQDVSMAGIRVRVSGAA